jgi:prepilin-type N-terminal cleavage/methylation domain-containing protein
MRRRRAFTLTEMLVVLMVVLILAVLVVLALRRQREISDGPRCGSNLRSAGIGMIEYGNENNEDWIIPAHAPQQAAYEYGSVTYTGSIGVHHERETTEEDTEVSTTRAIWELVRAGVLSPKALICSSSDDEVWVVEIPEDHYDIPSWRNISYGYQVPFGGMGQPTSDRHQDMALMADKGPYGAALEMGLSSPGAPTVNLDAPPEAWRRWNSPNHGGLGTGEGQNVMYSDAHVEWHYKPTAGVEWDNIYTRWSDASGGSATDARARIHGSPPTKNETPWRNTDSLIYP